MTKINEILDWLAEDFIELSTQETRDLWQGDKAVAVIKIKSLVYKAIGSGIRIKPGDDYGDRRFIEGYNQATQEIKSRLEKL